MIEYGAPKHRGLLGFPHYQDLQALRRSAENCGLCRLMLAQIDLVVDEFRIAHQEKFFQENHRDGFPTYSLFLTRRRDTGKGFFILSHSTVGDVVYLLGAIGLAVREGKWRRGNLEVFAAVVCHGH